VPLLVVVVSGCVLVVVVSVVVLVIVVLVISPWSRVARGAARPDPPDSYSPVRYPTIPTI
jgi:hypothetical protein